jgi:translation initiation factor 2 subunit 2
MTENDPVDDPLALDLTKKKKKPKKVKVLPEDEGEHAQGGTSEDPLAAAEAAAFELGRMNLIDAKNEWPDYTYEDLIGLVFGIMREKNPDLGGDKKKFVMKPPQVARAGSKKTAFTNYSEICKLLKRQPKHVLQFLLAELGTTGSIDGNQCLIVKGRFQQKHFESVLRKYIKEYVTCHTCKSSDTDLIKDTRLYFLQCKTCGSRCSVTAIKTGFTAMVGKRAAARRAAEATLGK